jgi:protein-tyrosine-phosphatase
MAEDADRIYVMAKSHREVLEEWMPDLADRIALLDSSGSDISDPFGTSLETYRTTARRIQACLERRLPEILSEKGR